jgi:hypothetical protein
MKNKMYVYGTQNRGMADFALLKVSLSKLRLLVFFVVKHHHQTHLRFASLLGPVHTLPPRLL